MPMSLLQRIEPQEEWTKVEEHRKQLSRQLEECFETDKTAVNKLKKFLWDSGIYDISEMDYPLREQYRSYLSEHLKGQLNRYVTAYDRVKQHWIQEQMKTLPGKQKCQWRFEEKILFIPYHPDTEIVKEFDSVRHQKNMVWDFSRNCPLTLKKQVFQILNSIIAQYDDKGRKREHRLSGLRHLYDFCARQRIADLEKLESHEIENFTAYLNHVIESDSRKSQLLPILNYSRKELFLNSREINWEANIWYLERLNLPKDRVNPSGCFESISFLEITVRENRRYLQEYMKYVLGITGTAVSTSVGKHNSVRKFMKWLNIEERKVCDSASEWLDQYFKYLQDKGNTTKTFNENVTHIHQFYRFLLARNYINKIPFRPEYYLKKIIRKHHDRSVSMDVCMEILGKLYLLPDQTRCMYLHLWCLGLRVSEVCTLKGDAYYQQGQDAWIQVYQIKMKNYKRVPIPDALYQIMQVYIKKYHIKNDEYLFKNQKGGACHSATFRHQMMKFCEENRIDGGKYLFQSHDYRHTLATYLFDTGVSLQSIRDLLGHGYDEMTQQYVDYMPKKIAGASEEYFRDKGNSLAAGITKGEKHGGQNLLPGT